MLTESDIYGKPDSVEMEERVVDIYESADAVLGLQGGVRDNTAGGHTQAAEHLRSSVSAQSSKTERSPLKVVSGCLVMLCLLLLGGNIAQAVHYRWPCDSMNNDNSMNNDTLLHHLHMLKSSLANLNREKELLSTNYSNLSQEKDQLQSEVNQLKKQIADRLCPSGWKKFGRSCYYRVTGKKTWQKAREECQKQGADLVVINSNEDQEFIEEFSSADTGSWIGLTRTEGRWAWLDGTPLEASVGEVTFKKNWSQGWPRSGEDRNCTYYGHGTASWYNHPCSHELASICEK